MVTVTLAVVVEVKSPEVVIIVITPPPDSPASEVTVTDFVPVSVSKFDEIPPTVNEQLKPDPDAHASVC